MREKITPVLEVNSDTILGDSCNCCEEKAIGSITVGRTVFNMTNTHSTRLCETCMQELMFMMSEFLEHRP